MQNGALQVQLKGIKDLEREIKLLTRQLEETIHKMDKIQSEKCFLAQENETLMKKVESLTLSMENMRKEFHSKTEAVMLELMDIQKSRDALCSEGRNVVHTVRSWMMEQQEINRQLSESVRCKNEAIAKLRRENE